MAGAYNPDVNRRRLTLLALLLPLFIARSLLPIGFMLSFDGGTPQMVFCPSIAPAQAAQNADHAMHGAGHEHHAHAHDHDSNGSDKSHQTCPFAFAGAAPLLAATAFAAEPQIAEAFIAPPALELPTLSFHANPIRGPPSLS